MIMRRWSTLVSGFVFTLALAAGGPARAQWGFPDNSGPFGLGYAPGAASGFSPLDSGSSGFSPLDSGSFEGLGYGGIGGIGFFPLPGYGLSTGEMPQTRASFQSVSDVVTTVPSWRRLRRRVRRTH
jgi:hypothetical protein